MSVHISAAAAAVLCLASETFERFHRVSIRTTLRYHNRCNSVLWRNLSQSECVVASVRSAEVRRALCQGEENTQSVIREHRQRHRHEARRKTKPLTHPQRIALRGRKSTVVGRDQRVELPRHRGHDMLVDWPGHLSELHTLCSAIPSRTASRQHL